MTTQTPMSGPSVLFTHAEQHALRTLRARFQQDHDLFSSPELARLRFLRWLYQTGRLAR